MKKITLLMLLVAGFTIAGNTQTRIIKGVVNTLDSIPLIGVEIDVKSTKQTVESDSLGRFTVSCEPNDRLTFKARGFFTEKVKPGEKIKFVAVNMKMKPGEKQQTYAIGYGRVSDRDKMLPSSNMELNNRDYSKYNSILDIISSMGAQVSGGQVILRGSRSFQGSSAALIVIDGSISDYSHMNTLRPVDVKSIDILKDAAASVYGSQGANGVVLIETVK